MLAAALAAVWLAMPALAAVHGAVDAHEYCAEHQAFEHRTVGSDSIGAHDDGVSVEDVAAQDRHDDCTFDDALLRDGLRSALLAFDVARPCPTIALAGPRADAARPLAILASAPKTSPPSLSV